MKAIVLQDAGRKLDSVTVGNVPKPTPGEGQLRLSKVVPYTRAVSVHEVASGGADGVGHLATQRDFAVIGDAIQRRREVHGKIVAAGRP